MVVAIRLHGMDETKIIHLPGKVGEKLRNPHATLAMLMKTERAGHQVPTVDEDVVEPRFLHRLAEGGRDRLTIELLEQWLIIKGVQRGGATDHVQENDGFGSGRKIRHAGQFRLRGVKFDGAGPRVRLDTFLSQQRAQGQRTQTGAQLGEKLASISW